MTASHPLAAVLLVGGRGDRFWPRSRGGAAKPLLSLTSDEPMVHETAARIAPVVDRVIAVAAPDAADAVKTALAETSPAVELVREPAARSTAPALALAALRVPSEAVLVALPSDHHIPDAARFRDAIARAASVASAHAGIVCIGIAPSRPETSYGYIVPGESLAGMPGFAIASFVEKPPAQRATRLIEEGALWNSGIFLVRAGVYLRLIEQYLPELHRVIESVRGGDESAYASSPAVSVDHGLLEAGGESFAVRGDFSWDDLGDWSALARILPRDGVGNAVRGRFVGCEASHNIIDSDAGLIAAVGVEDVAIIRHRDVVLVVKRGQERLVSRLVAQIQAEELRPYR